jgi:hypothetical protein
MESLFICLILIWATTQICGELKKIRKAFLCEDIEEPDKVNYEVNP